MKPIKNRVSLILLFLLLIGSYLPTSEVRAAGNGQQIAVYDCKAVRLELRGYNQYGWFTTYTLNKPASCGWYYIYNWWWKSFVYVTPYYKPTPSSPLKQGTAKGVYVPVSQPSNWVLTMIPTPSERTWILWRAQTWVAARVPYSQSTTNLRDGYRRDCSGFVSFAWSGPQPGFSTGTWTNNAYGISFNDLQPGDALNSVNGTHMILFKEWVNKDAGLFNAYEQNWYYGVTRVTPNITVNKTTGKLSITGYTYPGTYFAIRRKGL